MNINEKLALSIPEAGALLGVSKPHAYKMAKQGLLPILKLGRRHIVPKPALIKMLENVKAGKVLDLTLK